MREVLSAAREFHGHLGPFLIVGMRMGRLALEKLNPFAFEDLNEEAISLSTEDLFEVDRSKTGD